MSTFITKEVQINGKIHKISCNREDSQRIDLLIANLQRRIDGIITDSSSVLNDTTVLLFAALEVENQNLQMLENRPTMSSSKRDTQEKIMDYAVSAIESLIDRVDSME